MQSQNGWPASPNRADLDVVPLVVNGVEFVGGVRSGDVHDIFEYYWTQYDLRVEPLVNPGCWAFSFRANRNDPNSLSNHSSATATDGNAPQHPNGIPASRNFSAEQISEIESILDSVPELAEVLRWGGHFQRTPDPMHVEINTSDREKVRRVADRIRNLEDDMAMTPAERKAFVDDIAEAAARKVQRTLLTDQKDAPKGRYLGATLTGIYNLLLEIKAAVKEKS